MTYNKNTWNPYNSSMTYDQNKTNGGVVDSVKLNNMETGISNAFDKTSDTIGGRNVLLGTQVDNVIPSIDGNNFNFHILNPTTLVPGKVYTFSAEVTLTGSSDSLASIHVDGPDINTFIVGTDSFPADGNRHSWSFMCPTGKNIYGIIIYAGITGHTAGIGATWHHVKIEQGSIATDWTPAPEDKVTDNHDNTVTANNVKYDLSKTGITPLGTVNSGSFNDLPLGTVFTDPPMTDGPDTIHSFTTTTFLSSEWGGRKAQIAITDNANLMYFRVYGGVVWSSWTLLSDDSKVVHSTDMRKPASDVVGLEDVPQAVVHSELTSGVDLDTVLTPGVYPFKAVSFTNYIDSGTYWGYLVVTSEGNIVTQTAHTTGPAQPLYRMLSGAFSGSWSPWVKMANDYAVAHLSGANNFDTVPTVNNNPLLLASSLPADLARTGQDEHFTRNITFDNIPRMSNGDPLATASQTGDVNKLLTKDKSSYVNSINELASIVDRFYPVASQVIPTDNISYSNQCLVYNYDPSKNTVTFRKNDASYSINYDTSAVGTNFTENSGGAAPLDGIRIYFGFKSEHYINGSEGTLSDQSYYVWDPNNSGSIKRGRLGLLKGIPYYLTSDNFDVGSNYTIDFSGNGMNLSASGNNRIAPKLIISNKGNGVLNITPYHGEDFRDDKSEGYWIYPYITKIVSYSIDTTAMKALPNGYSYDYVKDNSAQSTGNYLTAWGQGSYQYKFDLNNLGNGYSIDSMGSSITINVSIKGTESSTTSPYGATDGYKSSQFPNGTFTTYSGDTVIGQSAINLSWRLSKEDVVSSSYTAYYQAMAGGSSAIFYAIKLVINNDNTISIYVVNPFASYNYNYTYTTNPSMSSPNAQPISNSTTISIVNNV